MIGNNTNEIINELFSLLLTRYQIRLEILMKGGNFPFESTDEICYICPRIILNCGA